MIDARGGLLTPALVEPHIHLDAVLTVGQPRHNLSGSLFEGIAIWGERVKDLTVADVKRRVAQVLRWQVANGVLFVRSHVDVCDPKLTALRALLEIKQEFADQITLQLVAFPQQGIQSFPDGERLMRQAVEATNLDRIIILLSIYNKPAECLHHQPAGCNLETQKQIVHFVVVINWISIGLLLVGVLALYAHRKSKKQS